MEVGSRGDRQAARIFEAHLLFLEDPTLRDPARELIFKERCNAAQAWHRASETVANSYREAEEEYLRGRAMDVLDVERQVIAHLLGVVADDVLFDNPGILVADDLTPAVTARLDPALVLGICTASGSPTSHSAILARTFGIPAVVGLGNGILQITEGITLIVDADQGCVIPDPSDEAVRECQQRVVALEAEAAESLAESAGPAVSVDGRRIEIGANIGSLAEAHAALAAGAEGVGLLRTEFLFLDRKDAPDEEEQFEAYRDIAAAMAGRPVIIRTLDIGGDKPLPYIDLGQEANPFLGWRAIRMCLAQPDFFKIQLRAILRAAALHPIKVMVPMVATLEEIRSFKALLTQARVEALQAGHTVPERIETGIMIEVPAAALQADALAEEVDFFSIGTNDLTQYTMAAERGNPRVANLGDPCHPVILGLVKRIADAAHGHGKWVGICGELGGDLDVTVVLLGLGIDELSMNPPAIPGVKKRIRAQAFSKAQDLAATVLTLETAADVRRVCSDRAR
jgi:phosphocarrier protein FPr